MYRIIARIKGYFRRRRFYKLSGVKFHLYGEGVPFWAGWYEADGQCLAFEDTSGELFFDW